MFLAQLDDHALHRKHQFSWYRNGGRERAHTSGNLLLAITVYHDGDLAVRRLLDFPHIV